MPAYADVATFKALSTMPDSRVDELETLYPAPSGGLSWLSQRLLWRSAWLDAQLRKRYAAPFAKDPSGNYPTTVVGWLVEIETLHAQLKLGVDATDAQFVEIKNLAEKAEKQVSEAADSVTGLYDLPLRTDGSIGSGITRGGTRGYSQQSPYVALDEQSDVARIEDQFGGGSNS